MQSQTERSFSHGRTGEYSLWELLKNFGYLLVRILEGFKVYRDLAERGTLILPKDDPNRSFYLHLDYVRELCRELDLESTLVRIELFMLYPGHMDTAEFVRQLNELERHIERDLMSKLFAYLPQQRRDFWNDRVNVSLISQSFPSTLGDLGEACMCYYHGRYTACVFHLMRAVEIGLRVVILDRRITFSKGSLDSKQWGEMIGKLSTLVREMGTWDGSKWKSDAVKTSQVRFYSDVMLQFNSFNEVWRKHLSHARGSTGIYDEHQANSAITNVGQFLTLLATKMSETKKTPVIWLRP